MDKNQSQSEERKIFGLAQKQSTYYEVFFQRTNFFKDLLLASMFAIASWPRLVLEVFLRRNMGERYFSMGAVLFIFAVLLFAAWQISFVGAIVGQIRRSSYISSGLFLFAFVFLYFGVQRYWEIKRLPSVFDFKRFSLATGETLRFFDRYTTDRRKLATIYEPVACFIAGLLFLLVLQLAVAAVLMLCSLIYSFSYFAAYQQGDNFLMDKIDERICAEDLATTFRNNIPYKQTRGAELFGPQPDSMEERQHLADILDDDAAFEVK